jgi:hypothetical protein
MADFWNAADLSADLGFGRNMPPRFWAWCKKNGLEPISAGNPYAFAIDAVDEAIARSKGNRR